MAKRRNIFIFTSIFVLISCCSEIGMAGQDFGCYPSKAELQRWGAEHSVPGDPYSEALLKLYTKYRYLEDKNVSVMFSGGLDTSFLTRFFFFFFANVTTVTVDVGSIFSDWKSSQTTSSDKILNSSKILGATHHLNLDGMSVMGELLVAAVRADAQLNRGHHPASSLSRIAISNAIVTMAAAEKQEAIFHGSNGFQNNPFRFFSALKYFSGLKGISLNVHAPNLDNPTAREFQVRYLEANHISVPTDTFEKEVSQDDNVFGFEMEEAGIKDPKNEYDPEKVLSSIPLSTAETQVGIRFNRGIPVAIRIGSNAQWTEFPPMKILQELNSIGLSYRIGISDYTEPRPIGIQAREIHIAPGMSFLIRAHHLLRVHSIEPRLNRKIEELSRYWSEAVMAVNLWTHPERQYMDQVFTEYNQAISGQVIFRLRPFIFDRPSVESTKYLGEGSRTPTDEKSIEAYFRSLECRSLLRAQVTTHSNERALDEALDHARLLIDSAYKFFEN